MKRFYLYFFVLIGFLGIGIHGVRAQKTLLPFDRVTSHDALRQLYETDSIIHLSFKPLLLERSEFDTLVDRTNKRYTNRVYKNWVGRKLYRENLAVLKAEDFYLTFDVLMNLDVGSDLESEVDELLTTNTRAVLIQGNITDKVYFRTDFYESQAYFPHYVDSMIRVNGVVPGQGKAKRFKETGYDYPVVTGIVNYQASKNVNLQFGHDKMFIGNGYRSLLLSDNTAPFLFFQLGLNFFENKLNYHSNWASLQSLVPVNSVSSVSGDDLFAKKQANFNYLSFKPNAKIEVGLFEGVMWERWNPYTKSQDFDPVFLNPIPFLTTAIKSNDTLVSSILGANAFYKPFKHVGFYGQFSYGVNNGGSGFQVGSKLFDVFSMKGLNLQLEYNQVGKGIYGNENKFVDYYHFNQPLAMQRMEDFSELNWMISYRYNRILGSLRGVLGQINSLGSQSRGVDNYDVNLAYLLNPITNLMVNVGMRYRVDAQMANTNWVYFGVKTNLRNLYYDF